MTKDAKNFIVCPICKKEKSADEVIPGDLIRDNLIELIRKKYPGWSKKDYICVDDLNEFRGEYVATLLAEDKGNLSDLENEVLSAMKEKDFLAADTNKKFDRSLTFGERIADKVADFGGSWKFIGIFSAVILVWIAMNSKMLLTRTFDPYPFILLNLVLSCLAAAQAPVIMMSQNRQEAKDRLRADNDYQINLKAEVEIRMLAEKIDHLITHHWQRLLEIQQIQTDIMEEISRVKK